MFKCKFFPVQGVTSKITKNNRDLGHHDNPYKVSYLARVILEYGPKCWTDSVMTSGCEFSKWCMLTLELAAWNPAGGD